MRSEKQNKHIAQEKDKIKLETFEFGGLGPSKHENKKVIVITCSKPPRKNYNFECVQQSEHNIYIKQFDCGRNQCVGHWQ